MLKYHACFPNGSLQRSQVTGVTMSKWFSTTVTGHRCDHVPFLPGGSIKRQQTLDNQYFNYILLFSLSFCIQIVWPFGFGILIKIFAVLWQIVKQIIFFAYILHFWLSFPPCGRKVTWSLLWHVTVLVTRGPMVTPVTFDGFFAGAVEV